MISVVSAIGLRRTLRRLQHADNPPTSTLNARGDALIGRIIVLDEPILNGRGRVKPG